MSKKTSREKISLIQFFERFPDEGSATTWFEEKRWGKDRIVKTDAVPDVDV